MTSTATEKLRLIHSGSEYYNTLTGLINNCRESIHLLVYILDEDETGRKVTQSLMEAARRGTQVNILVDAFGSNRLTSEFIKRFENEGIRFRKFSPYLTGDFYSIGRRMHIKLAVIDGNKALLGGINISNDYNDIITTAWLDYAVLVHDTTICTELGKFCTDLFEKKLTSRLMDNYKLSNENFDIIINDLFLKRQSIYDSFHTLIKNSREEIIIMVSYFLPGHKFLKLLAQAAERGVSVHLINSVEWDIPFMKRAILHLYPWLHKHNIKLYEWKPSVLHAKVMLVDRKICTLGSFNLNSLSRYNSLEMNINIRDESFVRKLSDELQEIYHNDSKVVKINRINTNRISRFINWINYLLIRLVLKIMMLFMKESDEKAG